MWLQGASFPRCLLQQGSQFLSPAGSTLRNLGGRRLLDRPAGMWVQPVFGTLGVLSILFAHRDPALLPRCDVSGSVVMVTCMQPSLSTLALSLSARPLE